MKTLTKLKRPVAFNMANVPRRKAQISQIAENFDNLSAGLYSNQPAALVRELACNAADALVEAGRPGDSFDVVLPTREDSVFRVRDDATGIPHDRCAEVIGDFGSSTKRENALVTGCKGLGFQVGYQVGEQFTAENRRDGRRTTWLLVKGEDGAPEVVGPVVDEPTTEPDGFEVAVAIPERLIGDVVAAAEKVLSWFGHPLSSYTGRPRVVNAAEHSDPDDPDATFRIENAFHRPDALLLCNGTVELSNGGGYGGRSRVVFGNVAYPLSSRLGSGYHDRDAKELVDEALIPADSRNAVHKLLRVGATLYFPLGDANGNPPADPATSREALRDTERTKRTITKRLVRAANEAYAAAKAKNDELFRDLKDLRDANDRYDEVARSGRGDGWWTQFVSVQRKYDDYDLEGGRFSYHWLTADEGRLYRGDEDGVEFVTSDRAWYRHDDLKELETDPDARSNAALSPNSSYGRDGLWRIFVADRSQPDSVRRVRAWCRGGHAYEDAVGTPQTAWKFGLLLVPGEGKTADDVIAETAAWGWDAAKILHRVSELPDPPRNGKGSTRTTRIAALVAPAESRSSDCWEPYDVPEGADAPENVYLVETNASGLWRYDGTDGEFRKPGEIDQELTRVGLTLASYDGAEGVRVVGARGTALAEVREANLRDLRKLLTGRVARLKRLVPLRQAYEELATTAGNQPSWAKSLMAALAADAGPLRKRAQSTALAPLCAGRLGDAEIPQRLQSVMQRVERLTRHAYGLSNDAVTAPFPADSVKADRKIQRRIDALPRKGDFKEPIDEVAAALPLLRRIPSWEIDKKLLAHIVAYAEALRDCGKA